MLAWLFAARLSTTSRPVTSDGRPFRVGLLGHGTVGAAFEQLLTTRADAIEDEVGRRPELSGVLTRSAGEGCVRPQTSW